MPTREDEENYFSDKDNIKVKKTCYTTYYPFQLFQYRELPEFFFSDITIFCGNNGSGKSSILNIIAEKLALERSTPFNRSDFFEDYVGMCDYQLDRAIPPESKIITSDGVFEKVLDIRRINDGIDGNISRKTARMQRRIVLGDWMITSGGNGSAICGTKIAVSPAF